MSEKFKSDFSKKLELKDQNIIYSNENDFNDFLITVGVPTYKRRDTLERALKSLSKQTFRNFRVIVSDNDGVSKDTLEVIKKFHKNIPSLLLIGQEKKYWVLREYKFFTKLFIY